MKIVADENIPFAGEAFGGLGELHLVPAARMGGEVREAEVLIVRSVTRVDEALLAGARVRFVGTVTAGIDHVDVGQLAKRGITFASAAGCNSTAVSQHVAAFLCALERIWDSRPRRTMGIVGAGHCGRKVKNVAQVLGFEPVLCDPPLARESGSAIFRPLEELRDCDAITLHTPMIREGRDRTEGMIDRAFLRKMKPGGIVINTARGGLVDESALIEALRGGHLAAAALDVWTGEPQIDVGVLEAITLATPHVAGYSHEGRRRGTEMIHTALCRYLGIEPKWSPSAHLGDPGPAAAVASVSEAVLKTHPVRQTDAALRRLAILPRYERAAYFEDLRRHGMRHEFSAFSIQTKRPDPHLAARLKAIGFSSTPRLPS